MTEYTEHAGLNKVLAKVLADKTLLELNSLREQELKIDAVLKTKTSKDGENQPCGGPPCKVTKVSGMWTMYADAKYILVVDNYFFVTADDKAIEGMVFDALQTIDIKIVKGEIKLAKRRPDIEFFTATVVRYGTSIRAWTELKAAMSVGTKHFVDTVASGSLETSEELTPTEEQEPVESTATMTQPRRGGRRA